MILYFLFLATIGSGFTMLYAWANWLWPLADGSGIEFGFSAIAFFVISALFLRSFERRYRLPRHNDTGDSPKTAETS